MINKILRYKLPLSVSMALIIGSLLFPLVFSNIKKMTYSLATGIMTTTTPLPIYGFMHINSNDPNLKNMTFAVDFAGVYSAAKHFREVKIFNGKYDPMGRTNGYPPLTFYLYNKTFCQIGLPSAALYHILCQVLLLLAATYFVLWYYQLGIMFIPVVVIYFTLLFLTPIGLSWFERGQFDLYPALSLLFFTFAIHESKGYAFVLAAIFAMLKPTTGVAMLQALIFYMALHRNRKGFKFFALFMGTAFLTLILFPKHMEKYFTFIYHFQRSHNREGMTILRFIPPIAATFIPLVTTLVYLIPLHICRMKNYFLKTFLPYMTGLTVLNLVLPYANWEYRIICLLGFIPGLFVWQTKYKDGGIFQRSFLMLFAAFLIIAFHGYWFINGISISQNGMLLVYICFYVAVAAICISKILKNKPLIANGL